MFGEYFIGESDSTVVPTLTLALFGSSLANSSPCPGTPPACPCSVLAPGAAIDTESLLRMVFSKGDEVDAVVWQVKDGSL